MFTFVLLYKQLTPQVNSISMLARCLLWDLLRSTDASGRIVIDQAIDVTDCCALARELGRQLGASPGDRRTIRRLLPELVGANLITVRQGLIEITGWDATQPIAQHADKFKQEPALRDRQRNGRFGGAEPLTTPPRVATPPPASDTQSKHSAKPSLGREPDTNRTRDPAKCPIPGGSDHIDRRSDSPLPPSRGERVGRPVRTYVPDRIDPNDDHAKAASVYGLDLEAQAYRFIAYHKARGSRRVDWDAEFHSWLLSPYRASEANEKVCGHSVAKPKPEPIDPSSMTDEQIAAKLYDIENGEWMMKLWEKGEISSTKEGMARIAERVKVQAVEIRARREAGETFDGLALAV